MAQPDENEPHKVPRMTIGEHLIELRSRLIICVLVLAGAFVASWIFKERIMDLLVHPHVVTMRKLGLPEELQFLRYPDKFYAYMKVAAVAALFIASPILLYQMWCFIGTGLYPSERRWVRLFGPMSGLLFLAGALFGFFVLIPVGFRFLLSIGSGHLQPMIVLGDYLRLFLLLTLLLGLVFELPLVMMFVVKIGVLDADAFRQSRRYAILGAFILAAVLTPPDPFTQLMMAGPLIGLYEVGIVAARPSARNVLRLAGLALCVLAIAAGLYGYTRWRAGHVGEVVASVQGARYAFPASADPVGTQNGQAIATGARITTGDEAPLHFTLGKAADVKLNRHSEVIILARSALRFVRGELWIKTGDSESSLRLVAPDVVLLVSQAEAVVRGDDSGTVVTAVTGEVAFQHEGYEGRILEGRRKRFVAGGEKVEGDLEPDWMKVNSK